MEVLQLKDKEDDRQRRQHKTLDPVILLLEKAVGSLILLRQTVRIFPTNPDQDWIGREEDP